jgi:tRNA-splicing ligase RtcB (3'-phosphate/5'-hydroxy nucleic acid ligase)
VWHDGPLPEGVRASAQRLADSDDVRHVALMPDAHLAEDVCVGAVLATSGTLYPSAVGGDIGCGMAAVAFDVEAAAVAEPSVAARILSALAGSVPFARHRRAACPSLPPALRERRLSSSDLEAVRKREAEMQLGTIGSGNHFIELQADEDGRLWLMLHSGSRGIGPAIRDHHLRRCRAGRLGLRFLDAESEAGRAYLADVAWALAYAEASRRRMVEVVADVLGRVAGAAPLWDSFLSCHHNHVRREIHGSETLWVHRKGAIPAAEGVVGLLPGSMGTFSVHVVGRGNEASLGSCAHGAGRRLSRTAARHHISVSQLGRETAGVLFDHRVARSLREEAPSAYKDLTHVLRAQHDLARVVRRLRPVLVYKGT